MKFVIQRVTHASVEVEEQIVGKIGKGYLVLIGVGARHKGRRRQTDPQNDRAPHFFR